MLVLHISDRLASAVCWMMSHLLDDRQHDLELGVVGGGGVRQRLVLGVRRLSLHTLCWKGGAPSSAHHHVILSPSTAMSGRRMQDALHASTVCMHAMQASCDRQTKTEQAHHGSAAWHHRRRQPAGWRRCRRATSASALCTTSTPPASRPAAQKHAGMPFAGQGRALRCMYACVVWNNSR
jgi:hypothetical protein